MWQIQHDGQISTKVESSPARENYSVYKNSDFRHRLPVRCLHEGRFAIVTKRWAGDAMDAAGVRRVRSPDENVGSVRQSRVVLAPRPWCQVGGSDPAGDGGNKRRFTGESTKQPLKPLRGESRNDWLNLW